MMVDENGNVRKPVAYLAGFYMFYQDALERVDRMKALCDKYGITGIYPPQEEPEDQYPPYVPKDDTHPEMAWMYFMRDINHLKRSDIIITQMDDFYGTEAESGTTFECGVAAALGKRMYGYIKDARPVEVRHNIPLHARPDGAKAGPDNIAVEDYGMPVSVMFSDFSIVEGSLEDALKQIRTDLNRELAAAGYEPFVVRD